MPARLVMACLSDLEGSSRHCVTGRLQDGQPYRDQPFVQGGGPQEVYRPLADRADTESASRLRR